MTKPKMSETLAGAGETVQITGSFVQDWDIESKKAKGYCAVGFLACQSKSVTEDGIVPDVNIWLVDNYDIKDEDINKMRNCPLCDEENDISLPRLIYHWNDQHYLSFQDIAKLLKDLKL